MESLHKFDEQKSTVSGLDDLELTILKEEEDFENEILGDYSPCARGSSFLPE
jgi:hypothetical protein